MRTMIKIFAGTAGLAALATAAPSAAQYYGYSPYSYGYSNSATNMAVQRCSAAVQARLNNRGTSGILGALFGFNTGFNGRVLSVTRVNPNRNRVVVRGLATSGRMAYNRYGYGAYGAYGSSFAPDLSYRCSVDYRGFVRDVDINRR
jgi:hypothetical protein